LSLLVGNDVVHACEDVLRNTIIVRNDSELKVAAFPLGLCSKIDDEQKGLRLID
jgi:hypothetical protein